MVRHGAPARQSNGQPGPWHGSAVRNCSRRTASSWAGSRWSRRPSGPSTRPSHRAPVTELPLGLGTVVPGSAGGHVNAAFPLNDRYLALDAYKFNVPNTESTLPGLECPTCNPTTLNSTNTWTPKALAELVEGLGGAVVATHSQSGQIGMNMVRVLKENGKLNMLKGLIQIEGGSNTAASGTTAADFKNIPYLAFKGDYSGTSAAATTLVADIKALGGKADYIELDQPGSWQGKYKGPFGPDYVGPFAGVSHMMMIEGNPAPTRDKAYEPPGHGRHAGLDEQEHQESEVDRVRR